jgi:hypothetical protein
MRTASRLPLLLLCLCLVLPASALAGAADGSSGAKGVDGRQLALLGEDDQLPAQSPDAVTLPLHMDKDLAREHERFSHFAQEQVARMNANILGGRQQMHVAKGYDGRYHASYKAIDVPGVVCQVRRSSSNPQYYVGSLIYTEQILESVGESAESCRRGQFVPVSEKSNRLIYTSKKGGGWQ